MIRQWYTLTKYNRFLKLSREHHENKRKPQAIYMLKKKKQIEDILDRRLKTLETMETMLLKIEASQNDIQIVEAFNMGADTLRTLLDGKDLNMDTIGQTMEKIQDTLEDQKQVEEAMTIGQQDIANNYLPDINDEELEQELDSLQDNRRKSLEAIVHLTQPIDTESELLRLQRVLSSLNHPSTSFSSSSNNNDHHKIKELA